MYEGLNPTYDSLFSSEKDVLTKSFDELQDKRATGFSARGVSGRALSEQRGTDLQKLLDSLSVRKGQYGLSQLGREQQVADVGTQQKFTREGWGVQSAEAEKQRRFQAAEAEKNRRWQEAMQAAAESRAKKSARKQMGMNLAVGLGVGALTGGAGLLGKDAAGKAVSGWAGAGKGALMGLASGAQGVGQIAGYNAMGRSWGDTMKGMSLENLIGPEEWGKYQDYLKQRGGV